MKAFFLLPLMMLSLLLMAGCASAHPRHVHKTIQPVKKVIIVAPARPVTRTVIITSPRYRPATTRTVIIRSDASTTIRTAVTRNSSPIAS